MELRAPAYPLITIDPYFSVWAMADKLTDSTVRHWTGKPNMIKGIVFIDGSEYRFMGESDAPAIEQISVNVNMFTTTYKFKADNVILKAEFTSPVDLTNLDRMSRPVSFLKTSYESCDGKEHNVRVQICVSEELCLNEKGQSPVVTEEVIIDGLKVLKMGNSEQKPLHKSGDDIRIDWGYVYLAAKGENIDTKSCVCKFDGMTSIHATMDCGGLFIFAYDDIHSIEYFGDTLDAYWKRDGITIEEVIKQDAENYCCIMNSVNKFADKVFIDAVRAGGEKYAEMLELAYRQVIAAHKLVLDKDGKVLFISKECFSNGCAATVDVSYPSIPLFLLYNPELVKGMMRPVFKYAAGDVWCFDFAPHDAGQYPLLNGQVYSNGIDPKHQMPIEECGNMLVMATAVCIAERDSSFAIENMELLKKWADYLVANGVDPDNQLCTDDFAGHLAHNCNLSIKAIMGVAGYSMISYSSTNIEARDYMVKAREMAAIWCKTAANGNGSYRLAFDRPDTFSMKYNAVWDKLFYTDLFPKEVIQSEISTNFKRMNAYGMPLDNRARYTKSDWLVWTATLANTKEDFMRYIEPLWDAYNNSVSRVPMTDWYDTVTGTMIGFQHRTVQGGLFIKLLEYKWRFQQ
jgi:Domain of unknown function (DUF1793).